MSALKIAVAIPSYRRPELLLALTRSLPGDLPINVSDNDSSMAGLSVPFGNNVHIHHAERLLPIFVNWNRAVAGVPRDTSHVLIPSDDDLYLPDALDTVRAAVVRYPDADMWVFGCDFVDGNGQVSPGWTPSREEFCANGDGFLHFEKGVNARMPGVLFRRSFLERIGGFNERFELTASDSELIQRAALLGNTAFIPTVIGLYRVWQGSLTHARQATDTWLNEIDLWTGNIAALLSAGHQPRSRRVDVYGYRDEIRAQNLLAGLHNLMRKQELSQARAFLRRHPIPRHATVRTRLRLLWCRLKLWSTRA